MVVVVVAFITHHIMHQVAAVLAVVVDLHMAPCPIAKLEETVIRVTLVLVDKLMVAQAGVLAVVVEVVVVQALVTMVAMVLTFTGILLVAVAVALQMLLMARMGEAVVVAITATTVTAAVATPLQTMVAPTELVAEVNMHLDILAVQVIKDWL